MSVDSQTMATGKSLKAAAVATRMTFFVAGCAIAAWAPLVPYLKARAALNDGELGLLLMLLGAGSLVAMPLGGWVAGRYGCLKPIILFVGLFCLALPVLATASAVPLLAVMIFLFGAGIGGIDCVMNIHALMVEKRSGQILMSGFHAMYTLGGVVAALCVTLFLSLGATSSLIGGGVGVVLALIFLPFLSNILGDVEKKGEGEKGGTMLALPRGPVLLLAFICFAIFLAEGTVLDWGAIFTIEKWGVEPRYGGAAYLSFAVFLTATRFAGNYLIEAFGRRNVTVIGGAITIVGLLIVITAPNLTLGLTGYALIGIGAGNIVPIAFSAISDQHVMPHNTAVSMITLCGYSGILLGPGAIGIIAHHSSLTISFMVLTVLVLAMTLAGRLIPRRQKKT